METLKTLKYRIFSKKTLFLPIICGKCGSEAENVFKEKEQLKY